MSATTLDDKLQLIMENERENARQLALLVIEKPVPPIWMIFIPIFFVFYAWKLKQYSQGLKDFVNHYLSTRKSALDATVTVAQMGRKVDSTQFLDQADAIPALARSSFLEWITLLGEHYHVMLAATGNTFPELVRTGYRTKSNYLLFCNRLAKAEHTFNRQLLPQIQGDESTLHDVIAKIDQASTELRRREASVIFA